MPPLDGRKHSRWWVEIEAEEKFDGFGMIRIWKQYMAAPEFTNNQEAVHWLKNHAPPFACLQLRVRGCSMRYEKTLCGPYVSPGQITSDIKKLNREGPYG